MPASVSCNNFEYSYLETINSNVQALNLLVLVVILLIIGYFVYRTLNRWL